jgi:hypothetical protein
MNPADAASRTDEFRPAGPPSAADEPRLLEALRQYQAALAAGGRPDRAEFLDRFPEVADGLADHLDGIDLLHAALTPITGGADTSEPPALPLGDFRIIREAGRGGMGVVYEAEQLSLRRRVALKVLPLAATLDPRQLQRFHNEARAAASLRHPNIIPVHAVGCERGIHFLAMEFVEGRSLAELIRDLRAEDIARSLRQEGYVTAAEAGVSGERGA